MKRKVTTFLSGLAGTLALLIAPGSVLAQDSGLVSKVVPVEIFTCSFQDGKGMSDIDAAVDGWNAYMDDNDVDDYAAWTLTKGYYGPEQEFDIIWLGAWTDGNAMGAVTDMINATGADAIQPFGEALDCGVHVNLSSINYKLPDDGTVADGVLVFSNCNVEEGARYSDVASAMTEWVNILTDAGSEVALYHWFPAFGGGGDEGPDYLSVRSYPNYAALGADYERQGNGGLFRTTGRLFGDLVDCDVARVYDAKSRRSAQIR